MFHSAVTPCQCHVISVSILGGGGKVAQRSRVCGSDQKVGGSNQVRSAYFDNSLPVCMSLTSPTSASDWLTKGRVMCYNVYVIMHVKIPSYLS